MTSVVEACAFAYAEKAAENDLPPVSGITVGYYLCQHGWVVVEFDTRERHLPDGTWTHAIGRELISIPRWKTSHHALQKRGGTIILPDGKKRVVYPSDECAPLAAFHGEMIEAALLNAQSRGAFKKLPKHKGCRIDIEEFDGMWGWPTNGKARRA
jgi:hypothetical protein